jgi:hypothetical protein
MISIFLSSSFVLSMCRRFFGQRLANAAPRLFCTKTATFKIKHIGTNTPKISLFFPSSKCIDYLLIGDTKAPSMHQEPERQVHAYDLPDSYLSNDNHHGKHIMPNLGHTWINIWTSIR